MSQTVSDTEYNIRLLIDDLDKDNYAISSVRMRNIIQNKVQRIAGRIIPAINAAPPSTIPLVVGTYDYTITGGIAGIRQVIHKATGWELELKDLEWINAAYFQDADHPQTGPYPQYYAPYKTSAQLDRIRIAPTPTASGTLNVYKDSFPITTTLATSPIPFSTQLLGALEKACALESLATMSPEDRAQRMVSTEVAKLWADEVEQAIRNENWQNRMFGGNQDTIDPVEAT